MNTGKEFEKYAVKHKGISSNTLHGYINQTSPILLQILLRNGQ